MFKKIFMGVLCIMMAFTLVGFDLFNGPTFYCINVKIPPEFQQEFEEQQFTIEDFVWDNVKIIIYQGWHAEYLEPGGYITIYLKEVKEKEVLDAIEHFETLSFVNKAIKLEEEFVLDKVGVNIKAEFQQKFESREFTIEDFEWDNVKSVKYITSNLTDTDFNPIPDSNRYVEIYLKKPGRNRVFDAIEHFRTLDLVEDVDVTYRGSIY